MRSRNGFVPGSVRFGNNGTVRDVQHWQRGRPLPMATHLAVEKRPRKSLLSASIKFDHRTLPACRGYVSKICGPQTLQSLWHNSSWLLFSFSCLVQSDIFPRHRVEPKRTHNRSQFDLPAKCFPTQLAARRPLGQLTATDAHVQHQVDRTLICTKHIIVLICFLPRFSFPLPNRFQFFVAPPTPTTRTRRTRHATHHTTQLNNTP